MKHERLLQLAGIITEAKLKISSDQKHGFHVNIEKETRDNSDYRRVLYTTKDNQLVVMRLKPGEEIGFEVHDNTSQFLRFEAGQGKCVIGGQEYTVGNGDSVIIPEGVKHNVTNTSSSEDLKLYTVYSPPVHQDGVKFKTKEEAKQEEGVIATHKA